ncbi:MAG: hypothetical protein ACJ713_04425 [Candidatus Sulfotelmatobacter sp.]
MNSETYIVRRDQARYQSGDQAGQKNAGLKAVTLIATLNPVSQVLW